ncbi:MAG: hypothetical protein ACOC8B_03630 [Gemmatimonadota bacterium]
MTRSSIAIARRLATPLAVIIAVAGCTEASTSGPDSKRLSGVYSISDWLYVFASDTLELTDDSFLRLEFIDDEHVRGEGYIWINVPVENAQGEIVDDPQPILWRPTSRGPGPVSFEGWYYVSESPEGDDVLNFRFADEAGASTFVDNVTWTLSEDWRSYAVDVLGSVGRLRIVQSVQ